MRKWFIALLAVAGFVLFQISGAVAQADVDKPALVELFTSEGCSSCPPADILLQRLDRQPIAGVHLIVLSEHVDYWNHLGWKDPYSSRLYSERQSIYARRFGLDGPYTPQMVVDGTEQFVGSDEKLAVQALNKSLDESKVDLRIESATLDQGNTLKARLQTASLVSSEADIYVAVALARAESHVARGENSGRTLQHVSVVQRMIKIGSLRHGQSFTKNVEIKLDPGSDPANLRVVAFVQEPLQGKVLGATVRSLGEKQQARFSAGSIGDGR